MVSKRGKSGYRSFTLVSAAKRAGCTTKGLGGRFINKTPSEAARKAFSDLCRIKRIRGVCTLFVTIKDTTKGGKKYGKLYTYKLQRQKLAKPMIMLEGTDREFVIEYKPRIVRLMKDDALKCEAANDNKPGQTRGRPKKRTAKKTKVSANNVRRMVKTPVRRSKRTSVKPVRRSKRLAAKKK
jgi:hypothetical protein